MSRRDLKLKEYNDPSLNIVAVLKLSDKKILVKNLILNNIIATIYYRTNDEISTIFNNDHLFFRLLFLGLPSLTINVFNKEHRPFSYIDDNEVRVEEINSLYSAFNKETFKVNFKVKYFNIIDIMNKELLDKNNKNGFFNSDTNNVFIFKNVSWYEVISYFRKANIVISGGKPVERHILSNEDYLLSLFLYCINGINGININTNQTLNNFKSNLDYLYRFNQKEFRYRLKANYNFTFDNSTLKINDRVNYYLNDYYVSLDLKNIMRRYVQTKEFVNKFIEFLDDKDKFNFRVIKSFFDEVDKKVNKSKDLKLHLKLKDEIDIVKSIIDSNFINIDVKLSLRNDLIKLIEDYHNERKMLNNGNKTNKNITNNKSSFVSKREYHTNSCITNKNNIIDEILSSNDFNKIKSILNNNELKLEDRQYKIEEFILDNFGVNLLLDLSKKDNSLNSSIGIDILRNSIDSLSGMILDYIYNRKFSKNKYYINMLKLININDLIYIVLRHVIPIIYNNNYLTQNVSSIYEKIGKDIISNISQNEYINYKNFYKNKENANLPYVLDLLDKIKITLNPGLELNTFKDIFIDKYLDAYLITKKDKVLDETKSVINYLLGGDIVEYIGLQSNLYKIINKLDNNKTYRIIVADSSSILSDILNKHMLYARQKLPMIYEPNIWDVDPNDYTKIIEYGGYLTNKVKKHHYIHKSFKNVGNTNLISKEVLNTINYLQSIPLIINEELLNYLLDLINNNFDFGDIFVYHKHPNTNKLFEFLNFKHGNKDKANEILSYNSLYADNKMNLSMAILYKNLTFYHPLFMDWRGRIYTNSSLLSFQGSEFSRSLLLFKNGVVLDEKGLEALRIYLANCYGLNTKSIKDRLQWVIDNHNNIINIDSKMWLKAKEPFLFLTAAIEYKNYNNNKTGKFISKLPIFIDATCNGLQHLAAMCRDINLAKFVNLLTSNSNDIPEDVYKEMAIKVKDYIKNFIRNDIDGITYCKLSELNINRNFIKRGIMTISYGSTTWGIQQQLIEGSSKQFEFVRIIDHKRYYKVIDLDVCSEHILFNRKEINKLSSIIHNILYESYPSLKRLVNYFISINKFIHKLGLNIALIWKTPSGLNIEQKYVDSEDVPYKFSTLKNKKSFIYKKKLNKVNLKKQNLGVMPNIIHSMDATNICLLIKNIKLLDIYEDFPILTIHDCFATNANHIEFLSYQVKVAFLNIYKDKNFVESYHQDIINHLKNHGLIFNEDNTEIILTENKSVELPKLPNLTDDLNLKNLKLLQSKYFIH